MTLLAVSNPTAVDLRGLVQDVAADPAQWRPLVQHGPERHFQLLHRDAEGVVVGSAIVDLVAEHGAAAPGPVAAYLRSLTQAIASVKVPA